MQDRVLLKGRHVASQRLLLTVALVLTQHVSAFADSPPSPAGLPSETPAVAREASPQGDGDLKSVVAALVAANEKALPKSEPADPERAAMAREIVELQGLDRRSPLGTADKIDEMRKTNRMFSPRVHEVLLAVFGEAMQPRAFASAVERGLATGLDAELLRAGLEWERSPVGRRVTAAGLAAQEPAQQAAMQSFLEQRLRKSPRLDDAQARSCGQIVALTDWSAVFLQSAEAFAGLVLLTVAIDKGQPIDMRSLGQGLSSVRPMLQSVSAQGALLACLFWVRDLDDADVEQWLAFLRTEAGGRYARGLGAAMAKAARERGGVMFASMRQLAPRLAAQPKT